MPNAFIVKTNKNNPLKLFAKAKPKTPNKGIKLKEATKPKKSEIKEILAAFFCSNFASSHTENTLVSPNSSTPKRSSEQTS